MATQTIYPFTTAGNYTASDSGLIEVTGGSGTLKSVRPDSATWEATYDSSINASYVLAGTTTGTATGSPTITSNKLDCTGGGKKYVDYNTASNADTALQTGSIRFKFTPNYSGNSPSRYTFFALCDAASSLNNLVTLFHESGNLYSEFKTNTGAAISTPTWGAWSATAGQEYEFLLTWDLTTGAQRLFIDGTQLGSTDTGTGTRDGDAHLLRVGTQFNAGTNMDGYFADFGVYDEPLQTSNYTSGYLMLETPYSTASPSLLTNTTILGRPLTFTSTEVTAGFDLVKYAFRYGGQDYYWDGSAWATSSGYAQSNVASELTEQVMRELNPVANTLQIKVYLYSADGTTTPTIDSMTITYDARDTEATEPTLVYIEGYIYGAAAPISGQAVEIRARDGFPTEEIFLVREWYTIGTTDANGYFNGYVFGSAGTNDFEIRINRNRYYTTIPNQGAVAFTDLTLERVTL